MTTIVTILTEGYADWETALLNAAARSYFNIETRFATPGGRPVTSSGGLKVTPDLGVEDIDVGAIEAREAVAGRHQHRLDLVRDADRPMGDGLTE